VTTRYEKNDFLIFHLRSIIMNRFHKDSQIKNEGEILAKQMEGEKFLDLLNLAYIDKQQECYGFLKNYLQILFYSNEANIKGTSLIKKKKLSNYEKMEIEGAKQKDIDFISSLYKNELQIVDSKTGAKFLDILENYQKDISELKKEDESLVKLKQSIFISKSVFKNPQFLGDCQRNYYYLNQNNS
jgi:hypothetical protein